jgi:hypothetical protein
MMIYHCSCQNVLQLARNGQALLSSSLTPVPDQNNWKALHVDKPIVGRVYTDQDMSIRPDMQEAFMAQGRKRGT